MSLHRPNCIEILYGDVNFDTKLEMVPSPKRPKIRDQELEKKVLGNFKQLTDSGSKEFFLYFGDPVIHPIFDIFYFDESLPRNV